MLCCHVGDRRKGTGCVVEVKDGILSGPDFFEKELEILREAFIWLIWVEQMRVVVDEGVLNCYAALTYPVFPRISMSIVKSVQLKDRQTTCLAVQTFEINLGCVENMK